MTPTDQAHIAMIRAAKPGTQVMISRSGMAPLPRGETIELRVGDRFKIYAQHPVFLNLIVMQSLRTGRLVVFGDADLMDFDMEVNADA